MENEEIDLKAIGVRGGDKKSIIMLLYQCFELNDTID